MKTNDRLANIGAEVEEDLQNSKVEGRTLGKYSIGAEIGNGGMGTAYHAVDTMTGRSVVIKVVKFPSKDPDHRETMLSRFEREAKAACRVPTHPNVVTIFDYVEIKKGRPMLVMELVEGRTLRDELLSEVAARSRALAQKKAVRIAVGILNGLEAIHDAKIVHRDLKPGNIMLTAKDDQVKILDFGLGKATESFGDPALDMTLTQANVPLGSPSYMSPEQTLSLEVTACTDIYSVGVILFQMLTGKPPFCGRDVHETYEMHRKAPVPMIVSPFGPVPPMLKAIVHKALAKEPGDRYRSAAEMRAALKAVDFGPKPAKIVVKPKKKAVGWVLPLLALAALASLAVGFLLTMDKAPAPERGPEAVIKTVQGTSEVPPKAVVAEKAPAGISIPPPPPAAASVAQGCKLYSEGRTTDAIATLTRALTSKPDDAEGLFCLCGAYVRQPETRAEAQKTCKAYRAHSRRDADKTKQVDMWLRRIGK